MVILIFIIARTCQFDCLKDRIFHLCLILYTLNRLVRLRPSDGPPNIFELVFYLTVWSWYFEFYAPACGARFNYPVSDPWDIVCYWTGGLLAGLCWNFKLAPRPRVALP